MPTHTSMFQNSYVALFVSLVILSILFYLFEIGFTTTIQNGKVVKKFNWKYPLAISLIIWLIWHYYLYPIKSEAVVNTQKSTIPTNKNWNIDMRNWN